MRHYHMQLMSLALGVAITAAGGKVYVAEAGGEAKVALKDSTGAAATNPATLTNGVIDFFVADSVAAVDLYIQAPSGHFVVVKNVPASGPNAILVDTGNAHTTYVIPFSSADTSDATETDTGFDLPTGALALPAGTSVDVTNVAATETIDVGILSTEANGDADGFIDGILLTTAATVPATLANGAATLGILLSVQDSANAGDLVPEPHVCDGTAKSISYTLSSGTAALVGEGFIKIPVQLPIASL